MNLKYKNIKMIKEVKGDLFSSNDSLPHCVSSCFNMGKGIAVEFKRRFGKVEELRKGNKGIGSVSFLKDKERYIFYLITKEKYFDKPTYDTLSLSLLTLKEILVELNIKELSMPKIGCGLDKLEWNKVKLIIEEIFKGTNITITIYYL